MTQEFVTLPRHVAEHAVASIEMLNAGKWTQVTALAATLRAALEQPQVVRETAPNGATHIQPQQGAFYKRVDEKWYVWSHMEDGCPHRWYISPGTVESCLKPIYAATERLQNHVPDAGNMVQAGWKPVPVEPTEEMLRAGCGSESPAMFRESLRHETDGQKTVEMVEKIIQRNLNSYRAILAAAPQPPTTVDFSVVQLQGKQQPVAEVIESHVRAGLDGRFTAEVAGRECLSVGAELFVHPQNLNCKSNQARLAALWGYVKAEQPQGEQELCCESWSVNRIDDLGKIVDSSGRLIATVYGLQAEKIVACHNSYTHPQPKREPLTDDQISRLWSDAHNDTTDRMAFQVLARAIEAAHNIK